MIKIVVVILFIFNILACSPAQQAGKKESAVSQVPFVCIESQSRCEVTTDVGTFTLSFSGQIHAGKVITELPFQIQLELEPLVQDYQLVSVNSYLEGKSMFMGKIPVFFQALEENSNATRAETLLVNCSEETMTWRQWFSVEIKQGSQTVKQDFFIDFDSQRL